MGFTFTDSIPVITVLVQGFLSFFSPCVLPLLPMYIAYLSGGTVKVGSDGRECYDRKKVLVNTIFFVIGIAFSFFILGLGMQAVGRFFSGNQIVGIRIKKMKNIRIALKQFYPVTGNPDHNEQVIRDSLEYAASEGAGLICFPECSLNGYSIEAAPDLAISYDDSRIKRLCALAGRKNIISSFGFIEKYRDELYITQLITGPAGTSFYRKTHLGLRERDVFEAGDEFPIYCTPEISIGACLCWESHIPDIATVYRTKGVEILLVPYASGMTGEKCRENWNIHLPARASDNGFYVAAVNGLYRENHPHGGGLAFYDPKGRMQAGYFEAEEQMLFCEASGALPRETAEDMHHISYFDHRRPEIYEIL